MCSAEPRRGRATLRKHRQLRGDDQRQEGGRERADGVGGYALRHRLPAGPITEQPITSPRHCVGGSGTRARLRCDIGTLLCNSAGLKNRCCPVPGPPGGGHLLVLGRRGTVTGPRRGHEAVLGSTRMPRRRPHPLGGAPRRHLAVRASRCRTPDHYSLPKVSGLEKAITNSPDAGHLSEKPGLDTEAHEFSETGSTQFSHDPAAMSLHCFHMNPQVRGNLAVRETLDDRAHHLFFSGGE